MPRRCWARFRVIGGGEGFSSHEPVADTNQKSQRNACSRAVPGALLGIHLRRGVKILAALLQGTARNNTSACHVVGGQCDPESRIGFRVIFRIQASAST